MESISLNRLLTRLDNTLSDPSQEQQLRRSPYERQKLTSNLDTARSLLLTLEKQTSTNRIERERTAQQAELAQKRQTIKQLNARLDDISKSANTSETPLSDDDSSDDDEDILAAPTYAPAHNETNMGGLDSGEPQTNRVSETQASELRARRPPESSDDHTAASTTARENLLAGRSNAQTTNAAADAQSNPELLMSHNRHEQDALTSSLLSLAQSLKQSSQQFSSSLAAEKDVLKNAERGLDKSATGMEGAEREMGKLRRGWGMNGWWGGGLWGRVRLYAMIAALWVGCFLLVFVAPKLRF
ncbi:hypothetical protein MBLNU230_g7031t1 [Neophaeotheca triangularis]